LITSKAVPSRSKIVIRTVQPDREHAVLEVIGVPGDDVADELRQRLEGLLVAGVRYLLVDLADAGPADVVADALAAAGRRLRKRHGWLRIHPNRRWPVPCGLSEATPIEVFAIYRRSPGAPAGGTAGVSPEPCRTSNGARCASCRCR
jgi:hypothetical protein